MNTAGSTEPLCAIYVDMGTTNTRVWLIRGHEILARGSKMVGVGDTARDGSTTRIQRALKELIKDVSPPFPANLSMRPKHKLCWQVRYQRNGPQGYPSNGWKKG